MTFAYILIALFVVFEVLKYPVAREVSVCDTGCEEPEDCCNVEHHFDRIV